MKRRACAVLLTLSLILGCVPGALAAEKATTIQLTKTEGTVSVSNRSGRAVSVFDDMRIYNGYQLATEQASYAWLNLDSSKLVKLDAVSEVGVRKDGKKLELLLEKGNLFFNVTEPLDDDETLNIRVSTMTVGIRGTSGWVKTEDPWTSQIYVLDGAVEVSVADPVTGETKTETVAAGENATCVTYPQEQEGVKCDIIRDKFTEEEIDGFVLTEAASDGGLCDRILGDSGLDLRGRTGEAEERLRQDQAAVGEKMAEIQAQVDRQENHIASEVVWTDPTPPPAPTPQPTPSNDWDDSGDSSPSTPATPTPPPTPSTVTLIMPQDDDTVNGYLAQSGVSEVILQPGTRGRASTANILDVDSGITVPAGKTLTLQTNVAMSVQSGQTVQVTGTLTVGSTLTADGTLDVSGQLTVNGSLTGMGTLSPSGSAEIQALSLSLTPSTPGWHVYSVISTHYNVILPDGTVRWDYVTSTNTLYFYGRGSMESVGNYSSCPWGHQTDTQKVVIGNGVTSITSNAFSGFTNLTAVNIPSGVTSIGSNAFEGCTGLTSVTYSGDATQVYIGSGNGPLLNSTPFASLNVTWTCIAGTLEISGNTTMETIMGDGTLIPWSANLNDITTVIIGEGVTSIGSGAFSGCSNLTSVMIPQSVKVIGENAFQNCNKLSDIYFSGGTEEEWNTLLASSPLSASTKIHYGTVTGTSIYWECADNKLTIWGSGPMPDYGQSNEDAAPWIDSSYTTAVIKTGVTTIGSNAFYSSGMTSITISEGVITIGTNAFMNTGSMTEMTIPKTLKTVQSAAFWGTSLPLNKVNYGGTEADWNVITFEGFNNEPLEKNATIHCSDGTIISPRSRAGRSVWENGL